MGELNTVVCKRYLKNIGDALREMKQGANGYQIGEIPMEIGSLEIPVQEVVTQPNVWTYEGTEYVLKEKENVKYAAAIIDGQLVEIKYPEGLVVDTLPYKRRYVIKEGETSVRLETDGLKLLLVYGDGSTEEYKPEIQQNFTAAEVGLYEIDISYPILGRQFWTKFFVEVCNENDIVEIDGKYLYQIADAIRARNGRKYLYRTAEMAQAIRDLRYLKFPNSKETTPEGESYLEITHLPNKVYYVIGEMEINQAIDYGGLVVSLVENGGRTDVTADCTTFPADGTTLYPVDEGIVECQVEYIGETKIYQASFEISLGVERNQTVVIRPLYIYVDELPDQVSYEIQEGETYVTLDHKGIRIMAAYEDGSRKDITEECTIAGGQIYRSGLGFWKETCGVWWFDRNSFLEFYTDFSVYIYDLNEDVRTVTSTIAWKDPDGFTSYTYASSDGYIYSLGDGAKVKKPVKIVFHKKPGDLPEAFEPSKTEIMKNGVKVTMYAVRIFDLLAAAEVLAVYNDASTEKVSPQYIMQEDCEVSSYLTKEDIAALPEGPITTVLARYKWEEIRFHDISRISILNYDDYTARYPYRIKIRSLTKDRYFAQDPEKGFVDNDWERTWWIASVKPLKETIKEYPNGEIDYTIELEDQEDAELNKQYQVISSSMICEEWNVKSVNPKEGKYSRGIGSQNGWANPYFSKNTHVIEDAGAGENVGYGEAEFTVLYNNNPDSPYYKVD